MDYTDRLRSLAINARPSGEGDSGSTLDQRTVALVRLAALVAVGGSVASYGAEVDAAVDAGATANEIVDVLVSIVGVVGLPRAVSAAPTLALALGYDIDEGLERQTGV